MTPAQIEFYKRLAHGLALQFGPNCEVVVHDLETEDVDHSIVVIENGHVSGRKLGDGPSHIVLESMHEGTADGGTGYTEPEPITKNIGDLLEDLLRECEQYVGKPAALMTKDERIRAIGYLDRRGAFLISKSSERACEFFGISKYSFYSYLNEAKAAAGDK